MISKITTVIKLPMRDRLLAAEMFVLLVFGWIAVKLLPTEWVVGIYGTSMKETPERLPEAVEEEVRHLGSTLRFVRDHLPWTSTCMMDAIGIKVALNRRKIPSTMYVGFRHGNTSGPFNAHAWVRSGKYTVVGAPVHKSYQVGVYYGSVKGTSA